MDIEKKFINNPETCVDESLQGFVKLYPSLQLHPEFRTIVNANDVKSIVGLISGGGAGHEPFAAGFVGTGMLSAAVSGSVFASPPPNHIKHAIRFVANKCPGGVLVIIPNYTGDCLNFGLAVEETKRENINVDAVIFGEDCALLNEDVSSSTGRRGMCGMMFAFKIIGALIQEGKSLNIVTESAKKILNSIATMGVCIYPCSLPGQPPLFKLQPDEIEIGLGVHGEAGIETTKMLSAKEVVKILLKKIVVTLKLKKGDSVAVFINNLGGTSKLEEGIVANETVNQLHEQGCKVERIYSSEIMTSLNMAGVQICVLHLVEKDVWLRCLDIPTLAPAWPGRCVSVPCQVSNVAHFDHEDKQDYQLKSTGPLLSDQGANMMRDCACAAAEALCVSERHLNTLDSGCGDGDCGSTLRRLAEYLLRMKDALPWKSPVAVLRSLAQAAQTHMGGTSGALYSLFFNAAAGFIEKAVDLEFGPLWGAAFRAGIEGIMKYSKAQKGDRTMLDAMIPACEELNEQIQSKDMKEKLEATVQAVKAGSESTKTMKARAGRASYVNTSNVVDVDAGAHGVYVWINAIIQKLKTII